VGCSNVDSVLINVNQLNITDLNDTIICIGESLQLNVAAPTGSTYLWTPPTDLSNNTIANPITTTLVTITYGVLVTDSNGGGLIVIVTESIAVQVSLVATT